MSSAVVWLMTVILAGVLLFLLAGVAGCHKSQSASNERASSGAAGPAGKSASQAGGSGSETGSNAPAGSLLSRLNAIQSGAADKLPPEPLPDWKPIAPNAANVPVPLVANLVVVTAIRQQLGDYESLKTIQSITPTQVSLHYSAAVPQAGGSAPSNGGAGQEPQLRRVDCVRQIDVADLGNAHAYNEKFCGMNSTEHYPGTTAISAPFWQRSNNRPREMFRSAIC